jgi:hypothetical protein
MKPDFRKHNCSVQPRQRQLPKAIARSGGMSTADDELGWRGTVPLFRFGPVSRKAEDIGGSDSGSWTASK